MEHPVMTSISLSEAFHDRAFSSFSIAFKRHVIGLSFEVYNYFLPQLASKVQKKCLEKGAFYYINHHISGTFFLLPSFFACSRLFGHTKMGKLRFAIFWT